jgi:phenylacetate-CoA ligase
MYKIFNPFLISDLLFRTYIFKYYRILKNESTLKRQEILSIQNKKLLKVLNFATDNIPFYQQLKIEIDNTRNGEDVLRHFPIVNKKLINCDITRFHVEGLKSKEITVLYSGGSSGNPGKVLVNKEDHSKLRALILMLWENCGYQLGDPILQLGMTRKRSLFKKLKDISMNVTYEEAFKLTEEQVKRVLTRKCIKPNTCFIGYASGLYEYARIAQILGIEVSFKCVISLGDKMFDHYRSKIEEVFKTRVFDTYGSNEGFVVGGQHTDGYYYINDTHVFLEVVDENYNNLNDGQAGRVLMTCLDNYTMPLIRFDIGDILALNPYSDKTPLPYKTIKTITGRDLDILKTKNGYSLIVHFFTAVIGRITEIEQFRVVQETIEDICIEYIPSLNFKKEILEYIEIQIMNELPPNEVKLHFRLVKEIPSSGSGKPQIISSLLISN